MIFRISIALCVVAGLAGCASQSPAVFAYRAENGTALSLDEEADNLSSEAADAAKKTFADRVLAAIALERVTGRKPDPARLSQPY